jgi:ribosomal RNA-processing protein 9
VLRGHKEAITCCALSADERVAVSGGQDASVLVYDIETGRRLALFKGARGRPEQRGHHAAVLAVALSGDGQLAASGASDSVIHLWDLRSSQLIHSFVQHRGAVTALQFRRESRDLYSGSVDRTVKIWNCERNVYVDTLFGHYDAVHSLDALWRERAVTCGADKSVRLWKVVEESQLVFQTAHEAAVDSVAMVDEDRFLTSSADGSVALWHTSKKKPIGRVLSAHSGCWASATAAVPLTDLAFSGSHDGFVNVYATALSPHHDGDALRRFARIAVPGFVNSLRAGDSGRVLIAAVAGEHRLGRWQGRVKAKNGLHIITLNRNEAAAAAAAASESSASATSASAAARR